mmetsp:Transcript_20937/g.47360  ORF Transcript_20937/g.47360 Transcript_20937/m.47360 type:complete len:84 (+) Transcript_20937:346-597(+)
MLIAAAAATSIQMHRQTDLILSCFRQQQQQRMQQHSGSVDPFNTSSSSSSNSSGSICSINNSSDTRQLFASIEHNLTMWNDPR